METKEVRVFIAKIILKLQGLRVKDLLDNSKEVLKFCDIEKIKGVPCLYLRYNEGSRKNEWLCLEIPPVPELQWEQGQKWCWSKGGDYGKLDTLRFIFEKRLKINKVLKANNYQLIDVGEVWSDQHSNFYSYIFNMSNGHEYNGSKWYYNQVIGIVTTD